MAWGRLDDRALSDGKLLALSDPAWRMWGNGLIYCQNQLTDGFIPAAAIHTFGVRARNKEGIAAELCAPQLAERAPLWAKVPGGYQVHDYLDWNESKAEILTRRERDAKRKGFRAESGRKPRGSTGGSRKDSLGPTSSTNPQPKDQVEGDARAKVEHGEAFHGKRIRIPRFLHADFVAALGDSDFDLIGAYPRWDKELEASGKPTDIKAWLWDRLRKEGKLERPSAPSSREDARLREQAEQVRRAHNGCFHVPRHPVYVECIAAIVNELRLREDQPA